MRCLFARLSEDGLRGGGGDIGHSVHGSDCAAPVETCDRRVQSDERRTGYNWVSERIMQFLGYVVKGSFVAVGGGELYWCDVLRCSYPGTAQAEWKSCGPLSAPRNSATFIGCDLRLAKEKQQ